MKGKRVFYCELAYVVGIIVLALGTALMERANFGMSMIVAPAYLIHLKVSPYLPFFSFGMSEYVFQALLLVLLAFVMRKIKKSYFLSFATAFVYGLVLDVMMLAVGLIPDAGMVGRIAFFITGMLTCSMGVALLFHTYFPPEAYELLVKELAQKYNAALGKVKTLYDCCSCAFSVVLSLCFFGGFVGVSWGTLVCAILNGCFIGLIGKFLESGFEFRDALPLREKMN